MSMGKLALLKDSDGFMLLYQNGDTPVLGDDVVIVENSVVKCFRALADWYEKRYPQ